MDVTDEMVDRFLMWPIPDDFIPDGGVSFVKINHPGAWPIGTNLLTFTQARDMLEYVLRDVYVHEDEDLYVPADCHVIEDADGERIVKNNSQQRQESGEPCDHLQLDVSLETARALHRVWRALNDGDCPFCHTYHAAADMIRDNSGNRYTQAISCLDCRFGVTAEEIAEIQRMFAPAMDAAVALFEQWRQGRMTTEND